MITSNMSTEILAGVYDYLLMTDKQKFVKSHNCNIINNILRNDIIKRYKLWLSDGKPKLLHMVCMYPDKQLQLIDDYELLLQPQYIGVCGDTALMDMRHESVTKVALKM